MRNFTRAAAQLNLSQPPLSRQLAALEAALGVTLIDRSPRSVTLTAPGERFYADAKAILAALDLAAKNAQAAALGNAGKLAIGLAQESFVMALEEVAPTLRATILAHCRSIKASGRAEQLTGTNFPVRPLTE
jgi:DNA-binding transcriptional LysR family regulator